jgi:hypothetical protein
MAFYRTPPFVDDPKKREARLKAAPKAKDRYGNTVVKIGHYWCSNNFDRFVQLSDGLNDEDFLIICRTCDGRFFGKQKSSLRRKKSWRQKLESKWYMFVDPEFQDVY